MRGDTTNILQDILKSGLSWLASCNISFAVDTALLNSLNTISLRGLTHRMRASSLPFPTSRNMSDQRKGELGLHNAVLQHRENFTLSTASSLWDLLKASQILSQRTILQLHRRKDPLKYRDHRTLISEAQKVSNFSFLNTSTVVRAVMGCLHPLTGEVPCFLLHMVQQHTGTKG
jgi:hypothetical protein